MKIGIIGYGFLGQAMRNIFIDHHQVVIHDPPRGWGLRPVGADLEIICVPTPSGPNGECNTSIVRKVIMNSSAPLILIKSTVAPCTTDQLAADFPDKRIVFSPEYMGESKYHVPNEFLHPTDARQHGFMILGGKPKDCSDVIDIFLPILGPTCRFRTMSALDAEIVKYAENSFFAMKVTFANELRRIADAFGANYHSIREGWLDDPRVGPMHSAAFKQEPGFGGKCLPKDISALAYACREAGYQSTLLEAVIEANE